MNDCPRPLDPIDCEALASGDEPVLRSAEDAAGHLAGCSSCARAVERAGELLASLERAASANANPNDPVRRDPSAEGREGRDGRFGGSAAPGDLADRVIRIRPFSRRERMSARMWAGPVGFGGLLFVTGVGVLAAPGLKAGDQASLAVALLAPLASLARAAVRAAADAATTGPAGWQALADATRGQVALGLLSLVFLAPAGFVLSRVLARTGRPPGYRAGSRG